MEVVVADMDLPGTNSHNWAILLVHIHNLKRVLSAEDYVVVKFIVLGQRSQLGSWKVGDGTEPQSVDSERYGVEKPAGNDDVCNLHPCKRKSLHVGGPSS